jgi:hypothetical protein
LFEQVNMADFSAGKTTLTPFRAGGSGVTSAGWFSPLQPLTPVAPQGTLPRQYPYPWGANYDWTPRSNEPIGFDILRTVADPALGGWDLLRNAIERRKDIMCGHEWEIRKKTEPGDTKGRRAAKNDKTAAELNKFFQKPDGIRTHRQWMRMILEDRYVIDAVAVYNQKEGIKGTVEKVEKGVKHKQVIQQGKISRFMVLAGDTITRCLDIQGLTPQPPAVAYQQITYGSVSNDFTTNDLIYVMSNERANRRYGFSKVEQVLNTITLGLSRQQFQRDYYKEGNIPQALAFLDPMVTPDQITEHQNAFDARFSGNIKAKSHLTFLPGTKDGKPSIIFPKEVLLKDELDVWLMQIVCATFGVSAQPFQKQMNRASSEEANDASQEQSVEPELRENEDLLNSMIAALGYGDDYEFAYQQHREADVLKQAQADNLRVGKSETMNEQREARGLDPRPEPEADMLGVFSQTMGFIPLGVNPNADASDSETDKPDAEAGKAGDAKKPAGKGKTEKVGEK